MPSLSSHIIRLTRLNENFAEESIRSIYKEGSKINRTVEAEDFDSERKTMNDKIKVMEADLNRLEQICRKNNVDTPSRRVRERCDKADDKSRDTPRQNRQGAATKTDKNRPDAQPADDEAELTTHT